MTPEKDPYYDKMIDAEIEKYMEHVFYSKFSQRPYVRFSKSIFLSNIKKLVKEQEEATPKEA